MAGGRAGYFLVHEHYMTLWAQQSRPLSLLLRGYGSNGRACVSTLVTGRMMVLHARVSAGKRRGGRGLVAQTQRTVINVSSIYYD